MFYPADPSRLREDVDRMLEAGAGKAAGTPRMVLSPHAGFPYSGAIAARAFARLRGSDIRTVVLVGPSHVEAFDFTSVFAGESYETPLGQVPVDRLLAQDIAERHDTIKVSDHGHVQPRLSRGEHGLEVQLPFLQRVLPRAQIVPIVMGSQRWENCVALAEALADTCGDRTVLLASSDLSHFYDYDRATQLDTAFCDTLASMDGEAVHTAVREGRCEACGAGPVVATLLATRDRSGRHYELLHRANSGDVTGDRTSVVGYASALVTTS